MNTIKNSFIKTAKNVCTYKLMKNEFAKSNVHLLFVFSLHINKKCEITVK